MELFKRETQVDFMGLKKITGGLSLLVVVVALGLIVGRGLNFGLEFTGGTQIELRFQQPVAPLQLQQLMTQAHFEDVRVQLAGQAEDILIRTQTRESKEGLSIKQRVEQLFADANLPVEVRRVEFIGSEVGQQVAEQGGLAVMAAIFATMIYVALRFEYRLAVSAALALLHDALIVLGVFSAFQVEFDLAALAAILAVMGYSLNDTIVVFDRLRENFRKIRKASTAEIMNISINQTLSRTLMTSWLTLLVVLALIIFGGKSLFGFSLALLIGIVIGTYSSIYVAGAAAMVFGLSRTDMLPKPKAVVDDLP